MSKKPSNRPELDELSDQKRAAVLEGADAIVTMRDFARRSFDLWMAIARGVAVLRELADQRTARTAFKNLLKDHGYDTLHESVVSRLLVMAKHETAIRIWRDTLTERQREHWASPTSICNRCPAVRAAFAAAKIAKPLRKQRTTKVAAERALDAVLDHLHELESDERLAVLKRLAEPFGLQLATASRPVTRKAAAKTDSKAPLVWKEDKKASFDGGKHHGHEALTTVGHYCISAPVLWPSRKFAGYEVALVAKPEDKGRVLLAGGVKTVEQAKAMAAKDYASRN